MANQWRTIKRRIDWISFFLAVLLNKIQLAVTYGIILNYVQVPPVLVN